jgi:hypothetical protein
MSTSQFMKDFLLQESEDDLAITEYWAKIIQERSQADAIFKERKMERETQIAIANVEVIAVQKLLDNDLCLEEKPRRNLRAPKAA